MQDIPNVAP